MTKYNSQDLLEKIKKLQNEIVKLKKQKKYGLVWEDKLEEFEKKSENAFPVLKEKGRKYADIVFQKHEKYNVLIEGDNYHSLSILAYTHREKVDLIYIDPPYNTGNKDFKYNDVFVEKDDIYRHSQWLSFMNKRLRIAKRTLKNDGAIFISINEEELAQLKMLCDEIFGISNYLTTFTIKVRHEDRILKGDKDFHEVVEYLLMYRKTSAFKPKKREKDNTSNDDYVFVIEELIKKPKKVSFGKKEVYIFEPGQYKIIKQKPGKNNLKKINIRGSIKEGNSSGRLYMKYINSTWSKNKDCLFKVPNMGNDKYDHRYFLTPKDKKKVNGDYFQGVPVNRQDIKEVPYPNYFDFEAEFNRVGYEGGIEFRNGKKPIKFIQKILEIGDCINKKDAVVLDFFAGSGSTGEAVAEFNEKYKGNRTFILCTNNENDICEKVTYERMKNVMCGYKNLKGDAIKGMGNNLKYLKTKYVERDDINAITDEDKLRLTHNLGLLLALKEDAFEEEKKVKTYQIFSSADKIIGIYFSENKKDIPKFLTNINIKDKQIKAYIFSWDKGAYKGAFPEYENIIFEDIPEPILEVYKQLI